MKTLVLESNYAKWAKYNRETQELFLCFPKGDVYAYEAIPAEMFDNLLTAKDSTAVATETTRGPIGAEKPGSEGSFIIHHIVGRDKKNPPFTFRRLSVEAADGLNADTEAPDVSVDAAPTAEEAGF